MKMWNIYDGPLLKAIGHTIFCLDKQKVQKS